MPQLPSGLLVGLTIDPALEKARRGHSFFRAIFKVQVKSADDIDQAVSILYLRPKDGTPYPAFTGTHNPFVRGSSPRRPANKTKACSNVSLLSFCN